MRTLDLTRFDINLKSQHQAHDHKNKNRGILCRFNWKLQRRTPLFAVHIVWRRPQHDGIKINRIKLDLPHIKIHSLAQQHKNRRSKTDKTWKYDPLQDKIKNVTISRKCENLAKNAILIGTLQRKNLRPYPWSGILKNRRIYSKSGKKIEMKSPINTKWRPYNYIFSTVHPTN